MEVRRTVPVKLDVAESDAALPHDTIDQFRDAANYVVRHARDDDGYVFTSKRLLHDRTYADVRDATDLHANLVGFKHLRSLHRTSDGDAPVGVRMNAGMMTTSGFEPAPAMVRVGVHGESSAR